MPVDDLDFRRFIGCCGAYCKTCKPFVEGSCKGCKIGFDTGERDIRKAKCKMKLCCFAEKKFATCADCPDLESCELIQNWFSKKGYKYKKYKEAIEFIKNKGYEKFIRSTNRWTGAYGKLEQ
jgi:hypothetical protein